MQKVSEKSVPVLTATILNAAIFFSLFIYQLIAIPNYKQQFFGEFVSHPLIWNIIVTVFSLLIVILLICNQTTEGGHGISYACYGMVIANFVFTLIFAPELNHYYFNSDYVALAFLGTLCSSIGLGMQLSWSEIKGLFKREYFTIDNVRYYFADNIFIDDRRTVRKSILIAFVLFALMALLVTQHPITKMLQVLGVIKN